MKLATVLICAFAVSGCAPMRSRAQDHTASRLNTVCDVVACSEQYSNTVVAVRGLVVQGFEVFGLTSSACRTDDTAGASIWLTTADGEDERWASASPREFLFAQVKGFEDQFVSQLSWYEPVPIRITRDRGWRRLIALLEREHRAIATITGRLDFARDGLVRQRPNGKRVAYRGFGHMSGYSRQLVISHVSDVVSAE
jgi:hypothetical protein